MCIRDRPSIGFDRRTGGPAGDRDSYLPRGTQGGPINSSDVRVSFTNTPLDQKRLSALPELNDQVPEIAFNCNGGYPVQLIKYDPRTQKFELNPEAVNELCQFDKKISIVCLAGHYRTGKSFLLNKLLNLEGEGFRVDPSVTSCTQGIWIWTKPVYNERDDALIYFIDTEGSGSTEKDSNHDAKIFSMALLISSYFLYNSVGCIDENAINQLSLVTQISRNIQISVDGPSDEYSLSYYAPKFLWLLRDFTLEMQDSKGRPINLSLIHI
eukprot:TRINITY_DN14920_c0_g1_i1.p1 TRINITY_DN14920_c0_g1~~TRINITY_DN14920_c0_g1_i1.p1  ORF type:complete len:287 (-),score=54.74 TRINITY_DN14920_c0_g1_i1:58-861(-)